MISLKILCDNYVKQAGFKGELGLSLYIRHNGRNLLFDAGQSEIFAENAALLDVNLAEADYFVLSHGHFDHSDGLRKFLKINRRAQLYMRAEALQDKYAVSAAGRRYIGISSTVRACAGFRIRSIYTSRTQKITDNIFTVSGFAANSSGFEPVAANLYNHYLLPDEFPDEQLLIIRDNGLHVFCGCAHPGITGMLKKIAADFPDEKIVSLVGGFHLHDCPQMRFDKTVEWLQASGISRIVPLHCTGMSESVRLQMALPEQVQLTYCGGSLELA